MTGLERNADLIHMASYAPLFAHTEGWQWTPNLIWFDNLRSYGTPNYYVQQLFATNKGSKVLPVSYQNAAAAGQDGLYASSTFDQATGETIIKIVNTTAAAKPAEIRFDGWKKANGTGKIIVLKSDNPEAVNSLDQPMQISPKETALEVKDKKVAVSLAANSFSVIRVKL